MLFAPAIDAGTAETGTGSVDESAVAVRRGAHEHAKMINMTRLLTEAVAQARTLSAEEQDRIASLVFALLEGPYELGMER